MFRPRQIVREVLDMFGPAAYEKGGYMYMYACVGGVYRHMYPPFSYACGGGTMDTWVTSLLGACSSVQQALDRWCTIVIDMRGDIMTSECM